MTAAIAPIQADLPCGQWLPNGTMLVHLPTMDALQDFWSAHRNHFAFAMQGPDEEPEAGAEPQFLHPGEWVFGTTKVDVMRTLMRLGRTGIAVTFYACTPAEAFGREGIRGWWQFTGLPESYEFLNLMCEWPNANTDLHNPDLPRETAERQLLEQVFDDFEKVDHWELAAHGRNGVDALLEAVHS